MPSSTTQTALFPGLHPEPIEPVWVVISNEMEDNVRHRITGERVCPLWRFGPRSAAACAEMLNHHFPHAGAGGARYADWPAAEQRRFQDAMRQFFLPSFLGPLPDPQAPLWSHAEVERAEAAATRHAHIAAGFDPDELPKL